MRISKEHDLDKFSKNFATFSSKPYRSCKRKPTLNVQSYRSLHLENTPETKCLRLGKRNEMKVHIKNEIRNWKQSKSEDY